MRSFREAPAPASVVCHFNYFRAPRELMMPARRMRGRAATQAELLMLAANAEVNALNIDLVGLQQSGVEFI